MNPAVAVQRHVLQQRLALPSASMNQLQHLETPAIHSSRRRFTAYSHSHSTPLLQVGAVSKCNRLRRTVQLCVTRTISGLLQDYGT